METALVAMVCIAVLIVGMVTLTFNAFDAATTVADSLKEMEQQASEIRLTDIHASLWASLTGYAIAYAGDGDVGYLKTVDIVAAGQITDTVTDTLAFDAVTGLEPATVHVSGDIYAIAYRGAVDVGTLKTVAIATGGQITGTVIDTLAFDALQGKEPAIVHVSGDIHAIAYAGDGDDGTLKTVEIATDGQITDTVIDTLEFDILKGTEPTIVHVSGDVYAIAYAGDVDVGTLKTVEIAADGQITDTVIDTLAFDAVTGLDPATIHVSGDIYAIAYRGAVDVGTLKTVAIAADGQITDTVIDTLGFDALQGNEPTIVHVSGDIYAIAYAGDGDDGTLRTVEIATDGQITGTVIDTLEFDILNGGTPSTIRVSDDTYAIAYAGDGDDGFLKTVEIATDGQITDTVIDTLEFDVLQGMGPSMTRIPAGTVNDVHLRVANEGETSLAQFSKWDVVVQYEDGTGNYAVYTTDAAPSSNEWTVEGIYLPDGSAEVFDRGILDSGEQMKVLVNIDPGIGVGETVRITVSTPQGVTSQCLVTR